MNLSYFHPHIPGEESKKPKDKGLLSRNDLMENAKKKAQSIEKSKNSTGLMSKNESKLLTNDGREIFNENI